MDLYNYLKLIYLSFWANNRIRVSILDNSSLSSGFLFFVLNISTGLLIRAVAETFITNKTEAFFLGISQTVIFIFLSFLVVLFVTLVFHLIARMLGGVGTIKESLKAVFFSSSPLLILVFSSSWISISFLIFYLLIINFYFYHKYTKLSAIINITLPFLGYLIIVLGIFKL